MIRAFVAAELPGGAIEALTRVQAALRSAAGRAAVKWTRPDGMHLTLSFLGDISEDAVGPLGAALRAACAPMAPFDIALGALGCFPDAAHPRVVWAGLSGQIDALRELRRVVADATDRFAAENEPRPYVPHLTLGRVGEIRRGERDVIAAAIAAACPDAVPWCVRSVRLMRSVLKPGGAEHSVLAECPLGGVRA